MTAFSSFRCSVPPNSEPQRSLVRTPAGGSGILIAFPIISRLLKMEIPPEHHLFQGSRAGGCLSIDCSRRDQKTLTRFLSGHIRSLIFSDNPKYFEICPKCTPEQVTPGHILACLGLSKQDLVSNPLLTLDFFRVHRLMDLI
ncbi:hypothetical protein AVEN_129586-1 [Araneus ventricosus]|uniref:Uncharacterized protein n=1 Tax=Araneus ventricosus TaxID=182803 RepID=A0A4Y2THS1_ARAVE|nr:hypothetical protein AVEN_129586-1 [Araneus ventricosus]